MVRLTADLIWKSPHFFNAIRDRELDLRGNKIAVIENLGATEAETAPAETGEFTLASQEITLVSGIFRQNQTELYKVQTFQDQFDTIDLSDNEIVKLENFPYLNRLGTLLINTNRITRINPNIGEFLPKLHTLVLTNNRLVNLVEIDPLASLPKLQHLSLLDNNITKKPNYRLYVIYKLKQLRLLDFKKVKHKERIEAEGLFASKEAEEEVKKEPAKTFTPGEVLDVSDSAKAEKGLKASGPTMETITAIKAAIASSHTLEEVARLEKALQSGQLPGDAYILNKDTNNAKANAKDDAMDMDGDNEVHDSHDQDHNEDATPIEQD